MFKLHKGHTAQTCVPCFGAEGVAGMSRLRYTERVLLSCQLNLEAARRPKNTQDAYMLCVLYAKSSTDGQSICVTDIHAVCSTHQPFFFVQKTQDRICAALVWGYMPLTYSYFVGLRSVVLVRATGVAGLK